MCTSPGDRDRRGRAGRLASVTETRPRSLISNRPISSVAPNRFFCARSTRSERRASPSNISTTSTRCSSTRGPATTPSFVTCPISTMQMFLPWPGAGDGRPTRAPATPTRAPRRAARPRASGSSRRRRPRGRRLDRGADRLELGLGEHADAGGRADALGAQPHLLRRLLAGDQQHRPLGADRAEHGRSQARLADPGLAAEQDDRAGHEAAAEHAIELRDPRPDAGRSGRLD